MLNMQEAVSSNEIYLMTAMPTVLVIDMMVTAVRQAGSRHSGEAGDIVCGA